jgi:hypothetical protein
MFKNIFNMFKGIFSTVLLPFFVSEILKTKKRQANAEFFSYLADEIVTALAKKYPGKDYLNFIDEAASQLRQAAGLQDVDIARRVIQAAIGRLK